MSRHLIVSCGTSQIDKTIGLGNEQVKEIERIRDPKNRDDRSVKDWMTEDIVDCFVKWLKDRWPPTAIGQPNNQFGAEISTLCKMEAERSFTPAEDMVFLLHSDSPAGALCAAILNNLLTTAYCMDEGRIALRKVEKLRDPIIDKDDPEHAEIFLCKLLINLLEPNESIFVVTGGYRSIIPIFTAASITHAVPMYYLFEGSGRLRCMRPPASVAYGEMKRFWNILLQSITPRPSFNKVLTILLDHRSKNMDVNYGAETLR